MDGVIEWATAKELMSAFPGSFINYHGEFIAHKRANEYFNLSTCADASEVCCKVLEYLSRAACKTEPYYTDASNKKFQKFMRDGINRFLRTNFSAAEMMKIYTYLGNGVNRAMTMRFVQSHYRLSILEEAERSAINGK